MFERLYNRRAVSRIRPIGAGEKFTDAVDLHKRWIGGKQERSVFVLYDLQQVRFPLRIFCHYN